MSQFVCVTNRASICQLLKLIDALVDEFLESHYLAYT
jgi:hypothetical protein